MEVSSSIPRQRDVNESRTVAQMRSSRFLYNVNWTVIRQITYDFYLGVLCPVQGAVTSIVMDIYKMYKQLVMGTIFENDRKKRRFVVLFFFIQNGSETIVV